MIYYHIVRNASVVSAAERDCPRRLDCGIAPSPGVQ
jgi:hypothetical protein